MVEEEKKEKLNPKEEALKKLAKSKAKKTKKSQIFQQIATREIIERDFKEDVVPVTFETAPGINRTIQARRPTHKEMMKLMKLSIEASIHQGKGDPKSLERMINIIKDFSEMAASLSIDENLDKEFWEEHVSYPTLQNFITELISQAITGGSLSEEEIKSFR